MIKNDCSWLILKVIFELIEIKSDCDKLIYSANIEPIEINWGFFLKFERYKTNPFVTDMVVPVKGKQVRLTPIGKDNNVLLDQSTGEIKGTHVTTYKKVDGEKFIKLFTANVALTFDLTAAGIKTFSVLLWQMQHSSISLDEVDLDSYVLEDFLAEQPTLKLSSATFKRGLNELEAAKIIAKAMRKGRYFINPNFIFNGDRIAFTTVIERTDKKHTSKSNQLDSKDQE